MRIDLLTDVGEWGGTEVHVLQLARTLAARRHDVTIVELGRAAYSDRLGDVDPRVDVRNVAALLSTSVPRGPRRWRDVAPLRHVMHADVAILIKGTIDVGTWQLDLVARSASQRFLTIEHLACPMPPRTSGYHLAGRVPGIGVWWHRLRARRGVRGLIPDAVICVSDAVQHELRETYRFPSRKLVTIRNGVDVDRFQRRDAARRRVRAAWGVADGAVVLGAVGRLARMKGYDVAVRGFAALVRARPGLDVRLVIAGDGPERDSLMRQADAAGIANRMLLPGFTDRPEDALSALDIFVMPSLREGLPLALLEAMACACAPVAMSAGGISEVLGEGGVGWLVPAGDEAGFAAALLAAADAPAAELESIGRRGRERVVGHFNATRQFARIADAIEGRQGRDAAALRATA